MNRLRRRGAGTAQVLTRSAGGRRLRSSASASSSATASKSFGLPAARFTRIRAARPRHWQITPNRSSLSEWGTRSSYRRRRPPAPAGAARSRSRRRFLSSELQAICEARQLDEALEALAWRQLQRLPQQPAIDVLLVQLDDVVDGRPSRRPIVPASHTPILCPRIPSGGCQAATRVSPATDRRGQRGAWKRRNWQLATPNWQLGGSEAGHF